MQHKSLLRSILFIGVAAVLGGCPPRAIDPTSLYVGQYDCQFSSSEANVPNPRGTSGIIYMEISKIGDNKLRITFPKDSSGLEMNADVRATQFFIPMQQTFLYVPGRHNGQVDVLGEGARAAADKVTMTYTASAGPGRFTQRVQISGNRRRQ